MYTMHTDPGHGWLEVPVSELRSLGIADKITHCSYLSRDGNTAYLEEDCDLTTFALAKGWKPDGTAPIREANSNHDSFIRRLRPYC